MAFNPDQHFERDIERFQSLRPKFRHGVQWYVLYCPNDCARLDGFRCRLDTTTGLLTWTKSFDYINFMAESIARGAVSLTVSHHRRQGMAITERDFKLHPSGMTLETAIDRQRFADRRAEEFMRRHGES